MPSWLVARWLVATICGKLEVAFKASPSSQHQHCTDEAQKAETVLSAVRYCSLV